MSKPINILIGLTGSISVSNIIPYIATIQNNFNCRIHIMMTPAAQSFLPASTLIHTIDGTVFEDLSEKGTFKMPHVELTHWADIILILPASANSIAKAAQGFAQDIVSATVLAADTPTLFFPSMYLGMWRKHSVQRNIKILREDGFIVYPSHAEDLNIESKSTFPSGGSLPTPEEFCYFISNYIK